MRLLWFGIGFERHHYAEILAQAGLLLGKLN